jgi:hypothetical protein
MQLRSKVNGAFTVAVAAVLVFTTSLARANGRFPRGEHLFEYPSNPDRLLLAATYGLVSTDDGGKNWYYICETGFSLYPPPAGMDPGYTGDPLLALTADESVVAGVQTRITRSPDRGCGWSTVLENPSLSIEDIAAAPSNRNIVVALVRNLSTSTFQVHESSDGGLTWAPVGAALSQIVLGYTIDVDPKDPAHFMVTGVTSFAEGVDNGVFLDSTNRGMTWTVLPIPKTSISAPPYIAAVHPSDAKKIFLRTDEWVDDGFGARNANDALWYTKDGGQTWTELLRPKGVDGGGSKLYGFALSPDGMMALAGFGDPVEGGGLNVDRSSMGVYKSTGADFAFGTAPVPIMVESTTCLTWTSRGIYLCGSPDGMTSYIGFASDINNVSKAGITKIMQVNELKGEPPCCNGRAVTSCDWNAECIRFDACVDGATPATPDAAACMMPDAGRGDGGGTGGSAGGDAGGDRSLDGSAGSGMGGAAGAAAGGSAGAGTAGASGSATGGTGGSGGAGTGGSGGGNDGCDCRASRSRGGSAQGLALLLGLAVAGARTRARRRQER